MPRAHRQWSVLRGEIRALIGETDETNPFWTNGLLLQLWNAKLDKYTMQLGNAHEGWITDEVTTTPVAGQREYTLQEGTGRVKRVIWSRAHGSGSYDVPLQRNERWSEPVYHAGSGEDETIPTIRFAGELLILEPAPQNVDNITIILEIESSQARFSGDTSTFAGRWPDVAEALLVYDTALAAFRWEAMQGRTPDPANVRMVKDERDEYKAEWDLYVEQRTAARVFSQPNPSQID